MKIIVPPFTVVCCTCRVVAVCPYLAQRCTCGGTMRAGKKEIRRMIRLTQAKQRQAQEGNQ